MEQNTDDILNNPEKSDKNKKKNKSQEDVEETVSKCKSTSIFHGIFHGLRTIFVIEFLCAFSSVTKGREPYGAYIFGKLCLLVGRPSDNGGER